MGGRGASSGSDGLSAALRQALGRKRKVKKDVNTEIHRSGKVVNPNYGQNGTAYTQNCQRWVIGYEMQRRGYDVEALAYQGKGDDMFKNGRWMKMFEGQKWERNLGKRNTQVRTTIEQKMAGYGEGARAIVYVQWKAGSAHVFNVEQTANGLMAVDAQNGKVGFDISKYLDRLKPSWTMISRVDNLKPKDDLTYAVKKKGSP